MRVALINTNRIKPPIAPVGLDYLAEAVHSAGHDVSILDLCWAQDWKIEIEMFFRRTQYGVVGMTLRNTDDCAFPSSQSFLGDFADMVTCVRKSSDAVIVAGGVGFSVMPEVVLDSCRADAGIWGDGEFAFPELINRVKKNREWTDIPGLVFKKKGRWQRNEPKMSSKLELPAMSRCWVDNSRYLKEGGQIGFETKRGCPGLCIYCAEPMAKGRTLRLRPPKDGVDELEALFKQGINYFHTCDSEFNIPENHAIEVCDEIIKRGRGDRFLWYAYCSPVPFSKSLAKKMRQAGCVGIDFGVDSGDRDMLKRLKRNFLPADIERAVQNCKDEGIVVMIDLLLGAYGETRESIIKTIELIKKINPDRVGMNVGVRVFEGTEFAGLLGNQKPAPSFFLEPQLDSSIFDLLHGLVGDDARFLFFDPNKPEQNYNYNTNLRLTEAIAKGFRGAYWDILRRYS